MRRPRSLLLDGLLTAVFLGLLWLAVDRIGDEAGLSLTGRPRVVDGDTLALGRDRIRLVGIDAPERAQTCLRDGAVWTCGLDAQRHLAGMIDGRPVVCDHRDRDRYGRLLAVCRVEGNDLNARMVADGFAVAFGAYEGQEAAARSRHAGLWASTFDPPRDWRAIHGGMAETPHMDANGLDDMIRALTRRIGTWLAAS